MKTKIIVEVHSQGTVNDSILRMVANHNSDTTKMDETLLRYRYKCYASEWPMLLKDWEIYFAEDGLEVYENGNLTLIIRWKIIPEELNETESNLLTQNELS